MAPRGTTAHLAFHLNAGDTRESQKEVLASAQVRALSCAHELKKYPHRLQVAPSWCHYGAMDLTPYVNTLRRELAVAAEAGGDEARELAERLTAPWSRQPG